MSLTRTSRSGPIYPRVHNHDRSPGLFDDESDVFQADRIPFDVVCAGDSLTGWGNFGPPSSWPFRCYPEFLQVLCEPLVMRPELFGREVPDCVRWPG